MRLLEFLTLFQIIALRNDGDGEVAGILNHLLSKILPSKSGVEYLDNHSFQYSCANSVLFDLTILLISDTQQTICNPYVLKSLTSLN